MIVKSGDKLDFLNARLKVKLKGDNPGEPSKSYGDGGITNVPCHLLGEEKDNRRFLSASYIQTIHCISYDRKQH